VGKKVLPSEWQLSLWETWELERCASHIREDLGIGSLPTFEEALSLAEMHGGEPIPTTEIETGETIGETIRVNPKLPKSLLILVILHELIHALCYSDRYVELNPVKAKLVRQAEDWPWSSARAHVTGKPDGLTDPGAAALTHRNWRAMLRQGLEAGDLAPEMEAEIEAHQRTGRPWGDTAFVRRLEAQSGRMLAPRKPCPKPRGN